jgi:hypothetical protein
MGRLTVGSQNGTGTHQNGPHTICAAPADEVSGAFATLRGG